MEKDAFRDVSDEELEQVHGGTEIYAADDPMMTKYRCECGTQLVSTKTGYHCDKCKADYDKMMNKVVKVSVRSM